MSVRKMRIAVLISGGGSNLQSLLDQVHEKDGDVVLVVSNRKDAYGLQRAEQACVKNIYLPKENYHRRLEDNLMEEAVDLVVLAGYMNQVEPSLVMRFRNRMINIHPSLIPAFCGKGYYGIHVHEKVLEYGVKITGATVHFVDEGMDTGPIIAQEAVIVEEGDTPDTLQKRVLEVEHRLLPQAVKDLCRGRLRVEGRKVWLNEGGRHEGTD